MPDHPILIRALFACRCSMEVFARGPFIDSRMSNRPCHTLARHAVYAWLHEFGDLSPSHIAAITGSATTSVREGIRAFWGRSRPDLHLLRGPEAPDGSVVVLEGQGQAVVYGVQGVCPVEAAGATGEEPPEGQDVLCPLV